MADVQVSAAEEEDPRKRLDAALAAFNEEKLAFAAKRTELYNEWAKFEATLEQHEKADQARQASVVNQLAMHDRAIELYRREIEAREFRVTMRERALDEAERHFEAKNTELSNRQGIVESNERDLATKEENYRVRMAQLQNMTTEYFRK